MVSINSIKKGIVIDHIKAGYGIKIYNYLGLDKVDFTVALIKNAVSDKRDKKDIIKIENVMDMDFTVLGLIDPNLTINIIEDEVIKEKIKLKIPERVDDVIKCKNPRCITSVEKYITHTFFLVDEERGQYRCQYCDEIYTFPEL
ncbi:aspartate carbamoyltransferase regulatory chain [Gottschalkia acidurici 9a]|uniref:Aspartate carbamoyltransferase regulatory chain n=1 Tax=Gottschalkia acidurici (strain ATCC 7906 / DSM 604 / BCRC 14475 / CIP 104303 / KCTC 5404 / NCIMB 10678 / 9a) TaxID=1128398 RepID=K0AZH9_GOTA9|nr:aspartate carbamoyltransferase regulatory subunit [Gottschalkia acidurici]AFS77776.1 aspartate carbamoyltransferase regulatory chain [Gottschalkia acidurici 9a]